MIEINKKCRTNVISDDNNHDQALYRYDGECIDQSQ